MSEDERRFEEIFADALGRRLPSLSVEQLAALREALSAPDEAYFRATLMDLCSVVFEELASVHAVESTLRRDWRNVQRLALSALDERSGDQERHGT